VPAVTVDRENEPGSLRVPVVVLAAEISSDGRAPAPATVTLACAELIRSIAWRMSRFWPIP